MFDTIAPRYDLVNRIMTFGLDTRWRKRAVKSLGLKDGSRVLDIACGTGDFCRDARKAGLDPIGFDLSYGMLAAAKTDVPLVQSDGLRLPVLDGGADGITCGFALRNVVDIEALFHEFHRVLRPGGTIAVLEVAEPERKLIRWGHRIYFRKVVPFIGGLLSDRKAYAYLPKSTAYLPPRTELVKLVQATGFPDATSKLVGLGAAQIITGTRS
ncbi:MAG: ubiquinone/menaquinone biosynthesis methyltransferase [Actinobacteria bacterium]|nr:ubiquinone/menaquinone biosynthesis methyltransferase [Actinomycetota bacterium]